MEASAPLVAQRPTGPKYERYTATQPAPAYSTSSAPTSSGSGRLSVESWVGASRRPGIDAGIGIVAITGRWSGGIQAAQNRLGVCGGYSRVGVNYLWDPRDGSMEVGGYFSPLRF